MPTSTENAPDLPTDTAAEIATNLATDMAAGLAVRYCLRQRKTTASDGTALMVNCGSKDKTICPACANRHVERSIALISSGIPVTGEEQERWCFYFVTLTAPSFGKTDAHGAALVANDYRYKNHVTWNRDSTKLTHDTLHHLRRRLPEAEYAFAREWQRRAVLHLHGIVRVPAHLDQTTVLAGLTALRTYTAAGIGWGKQIDVQRVTDTSDTEANGYRATVAYLAKVAAYTAKNHALEAAESRAAHYGRLDKAARRITCSRTGCQPATCSGVAHSRFGYSGWLFSQSTGWSFTGLTRTKLRQQAREAAQANSNSSRDLLATLPPVLYTTSAEDERARWQREAKERLNAQPE